MPCYQPIPAYRSMAGRNPVTGLWPIVFKPSKGDPQTEMLQIPCGQCIGCRLERSRQWAIRCMHEAQLHEENCFITLTYEKNPLTLVKRDFQLFFKKIRKKHEIRYYLCGEYGEKLGRPHYHAAIFGYSFPDKTLYKTGQYNLYTSEELTTTWGHGYAIIGELTFESAAYIARYITKKITGEKAEEHYNGKLPEFTQMSLRPGIAAKWIEKYQSDVYNYDQLVIRNKLIVRPARYYDKKFGELNTIKLNNIKINRLTKAKKLKLTYEQLNRKEKYKKHIIKNLKRNLEVA